VRQISTRVTPDNRKFATFTTPSFAPSSAGQMKEKGGISIECASPR
jgi:hypothetical protein